MSKFDFILSVFPHRTTEDITEKYPREPEMRYNSTLTSPVCKEILFHFLSTCFQIWKRVAPFTCIAGDRKARLFPSPKKLLDFRGPFKLYSRKLVVTDLNFCAESVFERFNPNLLNCKILDCETCPPTTRPRQPIEMSKYGKSRNSLKV